jgi:hypothetical protein
MLGRPVLYAIAAAAVGLLSAGQASAGCYSCGCSAPVVYASPCAQTYVLPPMFVINQGPAYTLPVPFSAEPTPAYPYLGVRYRANAYYGDEGDEVMAYPPAYRPYRGYRNFGYRLDYRYRHFGRAHFGAHRFHDGYRRYAHMPRARMPMHMHMHRQMRMHGPMPRGPMPGFVHPQGR